MNGTKYFLLVIKIYIQFSRFINLEKKLNKKIIYKFMKCMKEKKQMKDITFICKFYKI